MAADDAIEELIERVVLHARAHPGDGEVQGVNPGGEAFIRRYFDRAAPDDLGERRLTDLYGSATAHLMFGDQRPAGTPLVRVYLPNLEDDGWQSTHTVIDVVTDDMPFLVDSVTNELNRHDLRVHLVVHPVLCVRRTTDGGFIETIDPPEIGEISDPGDGSSDGTSRGGRSDLESFIHIEVDRVRVRELAGLRVDILRIIGDVGRAVADWPTMRDRAEQLIDELGREPCPAGREETDEAIALLAWMVDDHFTFIGYREYDLIDNDPPGAIGADGPELPDLMLVEVTGTGLGILRDQSDESLSFRRLGPTVRRLARDPVPLVLSKANSRSTVHREAYLDYVGLKRFSPEGLVTGERRFLGLFASGAYNSSVFDVPVIRRQVEAVVERAMLPPDGHANKRLYDILETYPRDELFQISVDELFENAMGILRLQQRQRVRLFLRRDRWERFVSCLVYVPRDRYTTEVRLHMAAILKDAFNGTSVDFTALVTESVLARLHFVVHAVSGALPEVDQQVIEDQLVDAIRSWSDDLYDALVETCGEQEGVALYHLFSDGFPAAYREDFEVAAAVDDLRRLDAMSSSTPLAMSLYRPRDSAPTVLRLKIYLSGTRMSLSEVFPLLENMGVTVVDERPYAVLAAGGPLFWVYDFGLQVSEHASREIDNNHALFVDAFRAAWTGQAESDGFDRLVLEAGLPWRTVSVIRAYRKYQTQIGTTFSHAYVEQCLVAHADLVRLLMAIFDTRFNPERPGDRDADLELLNLQMDSGLDAIASLDEDRILRGLRHLVMATLRTNFYQRAADGRPKPCLSLKLDPAEIPDLPLPRPMVEIFVYSPRVEGVHLRGAKVARGGIRWSDRREDFRTEILGLLKAQMVKNAVIVPAGAKGGFVVKQPPAGGDRDAIMEEGVTCYRMFIAGLLDLTDNLIGGEVVPPVDVIRHDGDDTYLVVAADKGTATFSDLANEISAAYDFWLGDAFASGGSSGYDHKRMGITAKGAWESVKRHFRELGVDTQTTDFTVVGVGDMSGDVFGNGMLLSSHIRLVGAFDHRHIFLDPEPDATVSFVERERLFAVPRSSWDDYDRSAISAGGGVFSRAAKSIPLSPEIRARFGIVGDFLSPDDLVQALLRAPVDLLWNGGIGTYVKASTESHAEVGDKANDAVRVDGRDLACSVVGEGGNLGCTQRGRVEYALGGGAIFTDAIDNSAGVDCSDHEVNIKILLDRVVREGGLDEDQRDKVLVAMTDDVATSVLRDNYESTQALSIAGDQSVSLAEVHGRYMTDLANQGRLDRAVEFLPGVDDMSERTARGGGLTTPELAVLLAYTKVLLCDDITASGLPEDLFLSQRLIEYFPPLVRDKYAVQIESHPLRREIIATDISNLVVNRGGLSVIYRLADETQAAAASIARCHLAAGAIFDLDSLWNEIEALDNHVTSATQTSLLLAGRRLVERATRWLLKNRRDPLDLSETVALFAAGVKELSAALSTVIVGPDRQHYEEVISELSSRDVPLELATRVAGLEGLFSALDIIEVAAETDQQLVPVAAVYFELIQRLHLDWLRDQISDLPRDNRWHTLARASIRVDLYELLRKLTRGAVQTRVTDGDGHRVDRAAARVDEWAAGRALMMERYEHVVADLGSGDVADLAVLSVALRAVHDLVEE